MGHGNAAIYFDDGDGGDIVFGNVFLRCGDPGRGSFGTVFSHGGHDNLAENNIFIDCKRALGSAPWPDALWKDAISGGQDCFWPDKLLKEVDITKPPYTTRYPELIGFMDAQPAAKRVNRAVRNVLVACAEVKSGNWQVDPEAKLVHRSRPRFCRRRQGRFPPRAERRSVLEAARLQADPLRQDRPAKDRVPSNPSARTGARRVIEAGGTVVAASRRAASVVPAVYIAPKRPDAASTLSGRTSATLAGKIPAVIRRRQACLYRIEKGSAVDWHKRSRSSSADRQPIPPRIRIEANPGPSRSPRWRDRKAKQLPPQGPAARRKTHARRRAESARPAQTQHPDCEPYPDHAHTQKPASTATKPSFPARTNSRRAAAMSNTIHP